MFDCNPSKVTGTSQSRFREHQTGRFIFPILISVFFKNKPIADHHVPDEPAFDPAFPACISSFSYGVRPRNAADRERQVFSLRAHARVIRGVRRSAHST